MISQSCCRIVAGSHCKPQQKFVYCNNLTFCEPHYRRLQRCVFCPGFRNEGYNSVQRYLAVCYSLKNNIHYGDFYH